MKLSDQFEEVKLVYYNKVAAKDRLQITQPQDAANILHTHWDKGQIGLVEESKLLLLDTQMRLMSIANLSFGGMTATLIDPRMVFAIALKRRAHRIILAHNHPSGTLHPSQADLTLTENFTELGKMLNIRLEDHLILTEDGYYSMTNQEQGGYRHGW